MSSLIRPKDMETVNEKTQHSGGFKNTAFIPKTNHSSGFIHTKSSQAEHVYIYMYRTKEVTIRQPHPNSLTVRL